jgi:PKD repeat protein
VVYAQQPVVLAAPASDLTESFPDDFILQWSQESGPSVAIQVEEDGAASFTSPATPTILGFRLTVLVNGLPFASDSLQITVVPFDVTLLEASIGAAQPGDVITLVTENIREGLTARALFNDEAAPVLRWDAEAQSVEVMTPVLPAGTNEIALQLVFDGDLSTNAFSIVALPYALPAGMEPADVFEEISDGLLASTDLMPEAMLFAYPDASADMLNAVERDMLLAQSLAREGLQVLLNESSEEERILLASILYNSGLAETLESILAFESTELDDPDKGAPCTDISRHQQLHNLIRQKLLADTADEFMNAAQVVLSFAPVVSAKLEVALSGISFGFNLYRAYLHTLVKVPIALHLDLSETELFAGEEGRMYVTADFAPLSSATIEGFQVALSAFILTKVKEMVDIRGTQILAELAIRFGVDILSPSLLRDVVEGIVRGTLETFVQLSAGTVFGYNLPQGSGVEYGVCLSTIVLQEKQSIYGFTISNDSALRFSNFNRDFTVLPFAHLIQTEGNPRLKRTITIWMTLEKGLQFGGSVPLLGFNLPRPASANNEELEANADLTLVNRAPIVSSVGLPATEYGCRTELEINTGQREPDGDAIWRIEFRSEGAQINNGGTVTPPGELTVNDIPAVGVTPLDTPTVQLIYTHRPALDVEGRTENVVHAFNYRVSDGNLWSDWALFGASVLPNTPPVGPAEPIVIEALAGETVVVDVGAEWSDPDRCQILPNIEISHRVALGEVGTSSLGTFTTNTTDISKLGTLTFVARRAPECDDPAEDGYCEELVTYEALDFLAVNTLPDTFFSRNEGQLRVRVKPTLRADFAADTTSGEAPLCVFFNDLSTSENGAIIAWEWDFDGDGLTDSTERNPSVRYNNPGSYSVSLRVRTSGASATKRISSHIVISGSGSGSSVIQSPCDGAISTIEELQNIGNAFPPIDYYFLTKDIDASDTIDWNDGQGFRPITAGIAILDGRGFAISNLYINRPSSHAVGLFESLSGEVKNLTITNCQITGGGNTGALAGDVFSIFTETTPVIADVSVSGTITSRRNFSISGGIIGRIQPITNDVEIRNCTFRGEVVARGKDDTLAFGAVSGGIVGEVSERTTIIDCTSDASLISLAQSPQSGGIVGDLTAFDGVDIIGCNVSGQISASFDDPNVGFITGLAGGLVGSFCSERIRIQESLSNAILIGGCTGATCVACPVLE